MSSKSNLAAQRTVTEKIPEHLLQFIAEQDGLLYTPIDHASWRYILRVSKAFFARNAHPKYQAGLVETGISTERIPLIEEMDLKLRRFGWRAVPVSGFIPPAAFMEFQSLGILPIACEMRTLEHLAYTPAPDIVHEAAGHAPILADPEYAEYLRNYGETARKSIASDKDQRVYQAVRALSEIKEDLRAAETQVDECQRELDAAVAAVTEESEAALLARMNWWTVEYGLVGSLDSPKIYGAGLLSSVGESYTCLEPQVEKRKFDLKCIETAYDITRPQPQLFVTPDFETLTQALEEFAQTMAFRTGGVSALEKGRQANSLVTVQLDSGVQVSGVLERFDIDTQGEPCFLKFTRPTQLSFGDHQIEGQGPRHHVDGFSSPIGQLDARAGSAARLTREDLRGLGFVGETASKLTWASGIELEGVLTGETRLGGQLILLSFKNCTIRQGETIHYRPEWGTFDLICGAQVVSVFGGAADRGPYLAETGGFKQKPRQPKTNLTEKNRALNLLYFRVRELREAPPAVNIGDEVAIIKQKLDAQYPDDWLLRLELIELLKKHSAQTKIEIELRTRLETMAAAPDQQALIQRGLEIL